MEYFHIPFHCDIITYSKHVVIWQGIFLSLLFHVLPVVKITAGKFFLIILLWYKHSWIICFNEYWLPHKDQKLHFKFKKICISSSRRFLTILKYDMHHRVDRLWSADHKDIVASISRRIFWGSHFDTSFVHFLNDSWYKQLI